MKRPGASTLELEQAGFWVAFVATLPPPSAVQRGILGQGPCSSYLGTGRPTMGSSTMNCSMTTCSMM